MKAGKDNMSRTQAFMKNTIANILLQIVSLITGLIVPRITIYYFGSELNGMVTSIVQLIAYITLIEAGLSNATVFSLYKPLADNNKTRINGILTAAKMLYDKTGYIFLGISIIAAVSYPFIIKTTVLTNFEITFLFLILAFNGVLEFFSLAKYRALLTADQKTYVISLASITQIILNTIIIVLLSMNGVSITITRLIAISAILLRSLILWLYCKKYYSYLDFSVKPEKNSLDKRWDALYFQIIGVVHTGAPVLIATFLLSLNDVSIYSVYSLVVVGINGLLGIFTNGIYAGFGDLLIRDDKKKFKDAFTQFEYVYYIIITVVYTIMLFTYLPFIKIYTAGSDINYSYPILAILMTINGYCYSIKTPFGMLTMAAGKYRESRVQITIQSIIEITLGIVFGYLWGLYGIVIGAIIANLYRDIDFIFFSPKYLTKYSFKKTLFMWGRSIITSGIIIIIGSLIPGIKYLNFLSWIIYALKIAIISILVTLLINIITDYSIFRSVYQRLKIAFHIGKDNHD